MKRLTYRVVAAVLAGLGIGRSLYSMERHHPDVMEVSSTGATDATSLRKQKTVTCDVNSTHESGDTKKGDMTTTSTLAYPYAFATVTLSPPGPTTALSSNCNDDGDGFPDGSEGDDYE